MRTLRLLLATLAVLVAAGSLNATFAQPEDETKDKAPKVDKDKAVKEEKDKAEKDATPGNSGDARADKKDPKDPKNPKSESADPDRPQHPDHPHGAPPGLMKDPGDPADVSLPEPPALGKAIGLKPRDGGGVKVKLPGSDDWTELDEADTLPIGATVDATEGLVEVVVEADRTGERQNAVVFGSVFKIDQLQPAGAPAPVTDLVMKGGDFDACKADDDDAAGAPVARAARASSKNRGRARIVRGLWATAKGRFRTRGRHSAATVRGTRWATVDRCTSTTVKVFEGVVDVMDFELDRVFTVRAGERHVARGRRG